MDKLKKLMVGASTVTLLLGSAAIPAFAGANADCSNVDEDSFCDSEAFDDDTVDVAATNIGSELFNFDFANAQSGGNSQNGNEDDNQVVADDANASYETENFLNATEVTADEGATATNDNITDNSDGDTYANDNDDVAVDVTNRTTSLANLTISIATSGNNSQNNNDDENSTRAGWSDAFAFSRNAVNSSLVATGNSSHASNSNIHEDSFADAESYDDDTVDVTVENRDTGVGNITKATATSGNNQQNGNEDDNEIVTAGSQAGAAAQNFVNATEVTANGSADASNENITDNSDGDATARDHDTVSVTVKNRETSVGNVTLAVASSGGNRQNGNDDKNSIRTGVASAGGSTTNVVGATQVAY